MSNPLVSFMIWCYNQEGFIREALAGALAQDYSPLEIVVSDDCSKDRTFQVAQAIAETYKGPHKLVLSRNSHNLGIGGNVSRAVSLCRGELVVMAGGDDVSLPERTRRIVEVWNASQRKATSVYSRYTVIDERGHPQDGLLWDCFPATSEPVLYQTTSAEHFVRRRRPAFCGCAHAISPMLFTQFGPLLDRICYEDAALAFRTALVGGSFAYVNDALVKYRWHGANTTFGLHRLRPQDPASFRDFEQKSRNELERFVELYNGFEADACRAKERGLISPTEHSRLIKGIARERRRFDLRSKLPAGAWLRRLCILSELYGTSFRPREMIEHLPHLLPKRLYCAAVTRRNRLRPVELRSR